MGGIAKQNGMIPKCIGGVSDHVHLLVALPLGLAASDHIVPYGRFFRGTLSQALRAWLRLMRPSGTKTLSALEALIKLALGCKNSPTCFLQYPNFNASPATLPFSRSNLLAQVEEFWHPRTPDYEQSRIPCMLVVRHYSLF
jgi:hypothetical protein